MLDGCDRSHNHQASLKFHSEIIQQKRLNQISLPRKSIDKLIRN